MKCSENDDPDFLNKKINVDESISDFIELDKQNHQILIKSKLKGSGIMVL